jgi:uncharacterized protein YbbK (DUF523 family)
LIPVLVSACLLGERVRYDGSGRAVSSPHLERWGREGRLIPVCPEVAGGLPVPRPPAELQPDGRVIDLNGADITEAFRRGAEAALALSSCQGAPLAILKEGSPSCGSAFIHDGRFSGAVIPGQGVTARLLKERGVAVFSETQMEEAAEFLDRLEAGDWPSDGKPSTLKP